MLLTYSTVCTLTELNPPEKVEPVPVEAAGAETIGTVAIIFIGCEKIYDRIFLTLKKWIIYLDIELCNCLQTHSYICPSSSGITI